MPLDENEIGLFDGLDNIIGIWLRIGQGDIIDKGLEELVHKEIERCLITVDTLILQGLADQEKAKRSLKTSKKPPVNRWSKKK